MRRTLKMEGAIREGTMWPLEDERGKKTDSPLALEPSGRNISLWTPKRLLIKEF
jgi:hypothetical protein